MDPSTIEHVIELCEQMAFLLVDPVSSDDLDNPVDGTAWVATIALSGSTTGAIEVAMGYGTACAVASSMLGCDEDDVDSTMAEATVAEFANVVIGNLAQKIGGADQTFATPTMAQIELPAWQALATSPQAGCFQADEGPLIVRIQTEG